MISRKQKVCYICKKEFYTNKNDENEFKLNHKVRDHCHYTGKFRGTAHNICNLRYKIPREIPVVFHNGSKHDYHFIIKQLTEEFKDQFSCLGENNEKYITFSIPIKKELDNNKIIIYKLKFIDRYRFMSTWLSDLANNLSEINKKECKSCIKKITSECDFIGFKNNRLCYICKNCGKRCFSSINRLIKKFPIVYQFFKYDLNKFILLLKKDVYPDENMDSWKKFNETSLPDKKDFYSNLNLEDITDKNYAHAQKVWEVFEIKDEGALYVQCDTLLLADVLENFRDKCIEIYGLDPAHFLSAPGLAWQACLKKTEVKLELSTNHDMLLMVEEENRVGMCQAVYEYAKANNKSMKNYDKNIE